MSLFHLLLEAKVPFEVAHVNHHWREASDKEALELEKRCKSSSIPFHIKDLYLDGSNLEDRCREARYAFFKTLMRPDMKGVLLGHHAGDLVETVLKRLFEGARLTKLSGLKFHTQRDGMDLYRPLLQVPKKEILKWMKDRGYVYFEDETNHDPRFLRSRLRDQVIPELEKMFGKNIESSLVRIAESSLDLESDTLKRVEGYKMTANTLDLREKCPTSDFEWQMVVSNFFEKAKETVSSHTISQIIFHLKKGHSSKVLRLKNCYVKLRGRLVSLETKI